MKEKKGEERKKKKKTNERKMKTMKELEGKIWTNLKTDKREGVRVLRGENRESMSVSAPGYLHTAQTIQKTLATY